MEKIRKLAVLGVGLIGGSFASALKQAGAVERVVGFGRNPERLKQALTRGVVDEIESSVAAAVGEADLVLLATPVAQAAKLFAEIAPALTKHALISDVGSTKRDVITAARSVLGPAFTRFVPGHPIAGAESSGVGAARADLFHGRQVVLTPEAETSAAALERIREIWQTCGAEVSVLDAKTHDEIFASVSHLPHMLAFALVALLAERENAAQLFSFCGSGFRDFTRIAGSSPEMWRDIALANRDALARELAAYRSALDTLGQLIAAGDGVAIEQLFARARDSRNRYLNPQHTLDQV